MAIRWQSHLEQLRVEQERRDELRGVALHKLHERVDAPLHLADVGAVNLRLQAHEQLVHLAHEVRVRQRGGLHVQKVLHLRVVALAEELQPAPPAPPPPEPKKGGGKRKADKGKEAEKPAKAPKGKKAAAEAEQAAPAEAAPPPPPEKRKAEREAEKEAKKAVRRAPLGQIVVTALPAGSGPVRASARAVMCVRDGVFKRPGWLRNRRNRRSLRPFQSAAGEKICDFEGLSKKFLWILSEFQLPG